MTDHPAAPSARQLTPEEAEKRSEHLYEVHQRIKASLRAGRSAAWALAEALYEFDEENGWTALGYDSLKDYLADAEVAIGRSFYFAAVSRWRKLVVLRQIGSDRLDQLDPSKVDIVLPAIEAATVKLDDALDDVEALGKRDLREKYLGRKDPARDTVDQDIVKDVVAARTAPVNDGEDEPKWASEDDPSTKHFDESTGDYKSPEDVIEGTAREVSSEPAQNSEDAPSGQVPEEWPLNKQELMLLYQALQGWENKSRMTPCPRKDARALLKKLKSIIQSA